MVGEAHPGREKNKNKKKPLVVCIISAKNKQINKKPYKLLLLGREILE